MQYLVTASEMKHYDVYTSQHVGLSSLVLMERAALSVIKHLNSGQYNLHKIAVVCGYGNNGGDGVAVARLLTLQNRDVTLYFVGNPDNCSSETLQQIKIAQHYNIPIITSLSGSFLDYTTIVDAILGVGLNRNVMDDFLFIIQSINQSKADVLSIDIPSGIDADTGKILGTAVKAKQTVTFSYAKLGLIFYPGAEFAGQITVEDIGIYADESTQYYTFSKTRLIDLLPVRESYTNKGSFGKALVIAGSEQISGAAYLSAKAAYRTGTGLVRIYTPKCNRDILLTQLPEALLTTYTPKKIDKIELEKIIEWASVIVIGPGMGVTDDTYHILSTVLKRATVPVIIDADGLNILAQNLKLLTQSQSPVIITPHLGEMARLTQQSIAKITNNLLETAQIFAEQNDVICVLKDARTIVAAPNQKTYINQSGNNGMATGGSGDVLTGIMAGLIAQHLPVLQAAPVSVYLHGLAGDAAIKKWSKQSLLATDIIDGLTTIFNGNEA